MLVYIAADGPADEFKVYKFDSIIRTLPRSTVYQYNKMPSSACPQSCFTTCDIRSSEGSIYDANRNIEMPLSSEDVCDINTESTIQPTSD